MKKLIAVLAVLAAILLCAAALAENAAESAPDPEALKLFNSEWVDNDGTLQIYPEGDRWRVLIRSGNGAAEWDYCCSYDETAKALVSDPDYENIKVIITLDEMGSEFNRSTVYTDGAAAFSLDGDGKLTWKDEKEDVGAGRSFEKIGWFQGTWNCDTEDGAAYVLNCYWDIEVTEDGETYSGYKVEIERYEGEEYTHWAYAGFYNPETGILSSMFGTKEYSAKDGEPFNVVYYDGAAEFSFDEEGCIRWNDAIENAGDGLQFVGSNG